MTVDAFTRLHRSWNQPMARGALHARLEALMAAAPPKAAAVAPVDDSPDEPPTPPPPAEHEPIDCSRFEADLRALTGSPPPDDVTAAPETKVEPATRPMHGSRVGIRQMRDACCRAMAVDLQEIAGTQRHPAIVAARGLFAWSAHRCCGASYPEIARAIGRRNHSTVHCAAKRFDRRADRDELVALAIDALPADVQPTNIGGRSAGRGVPSASASPQRHGRGA